MMDGTTTTFKPTLARRFELPALNFKFESLTEGTDIPPPQPSPVREVPTPPQTPPIGPDTNENPDGEGDSVMTGTTAAAADGVIEKKTPSGGVKRSAEDMPLSPALSARQGSIRRLFSRSILNGHTDVHSSGASGSRPPSQAGSVVVDDRKSKRTSGWFRRFRGGGDAHAVSPKSFDEVDDDKRAVAVGPPPPMIPELAVLDGNRPEASRGDQWASDMFKNIS